MRRFIAALTSVLLLFGLLAVAPAGAVGGTTNVSVLHGIPGLTVDVYVDGVKALDDFTPGTLAGPLTLGSGTHTVAITADSAPDDSSPILGPASVNLIAGADMTIAAHLDGAGAPTVSVFTNNTSAIAAGSGRLTVRHLAAAPEVDVNAVGAGDVFTLANGDSGAADLPAATYDVSLQAAGTDTQVFPDSGTTPVVLPAGANLVVYAWGDISATPSTFALAVQTISDPIGAPATASVVHGVAGLTVDVYVNGLLLLEDFEPETVVGPVLLPAGTVDIDIFAADSAYVPGSGAIFVDDLAVPAGANVSIVAHLSAAGAPTASVFSNDLSPIAAGEARLSVRHVAAAGAVDVKTGDTVLVDSLSNPDEEVLDVPAATYPVTINAEDAAAIADLGAVALAEGVNTVVYAFGTPPAVDALTPSGSPGGTFNIMVESIPGLAVGGPFNDAGGAFFTDSVTKLFQLGITAGTTADTYSPADPMTRGMLAAFINRALGLPATTTDFFTDDETSVFEDDINRLAASGIAFGLTSTTFGPDVLVNRAQIAAFVDRAFSLPSSAIDRFTDDDGITLESSINNAAAAGVIFGTTDTTVSPGANASRGEVAAIFARALGVG